MTTTRMTTTNLLRLIPENDTLIITDTSLCSTARTVKSSKKRRRRKNKLVPNSINQCPLPDPLRRILDGLTEKQKEDTHYLLLFPGDLPDVRLYCRLQLQKWIGEIGAAAFVDGLSDQVLLDYRRKDDESVSDLSSEGDDGHLWSERPRAGLPRLSKGASSALSQGDEVQGMHPSNSVSATGATAGSVDSYPSDETPGNGVPRRS